MKGPFMNMKAQGIHKIWKWINLPKGHYRAQHTPMRNGKKPVLVQTTMVQ